MFAGQTAVVTGKGEPTAVAKAIMDFVNSRVNKSSKISDVEIQKEPFNKTATQKIRRFLYKEKKD
mgnify:CR=1 FL=1